VLPGRYAVCRLEHRGAIPAPPAGSAGAIWSVTRAPDEISIVCEERAAPSNARQVERGWRALRLEGPIPFSETGVLLGLAAPLAAAGIPIFALSTYDTDLVLVREGDLGRALDALAATHAVTRGEERKS